MQAWILLGMILYTVGAEAFRPAASPVDVWEIVNCIRCKGKGYEIYSPEHPLVEERVYKPGKHTCPLCRGNRKLQHSDGRYISLP